MEFCCIFCSTNLVWQCFISFLGNAKKFDYTQLHLSLCMYNVLFICECVCVYRVYRNVFSLFTFIFGFLFSFSVHLLIFSSAISRAFISYEITFHVRCTVSWLPRRSYTNHTAIVLQPIYVFEMGRFPFDSVSKRTERIETFSID